MRYFNPFFFTFSTVHNRKFQIPSKTDQRLKPTAARNPETTKPLGRPHPTDPYLHSRNRPACGKRQDIPDERPRLQLRELSRDGGDSNTVPHGETGEDSLTLIPFQVLSWRPRALYFPKFATKEQCELIIGLAKANLVPSSLALRKGETVESTQNIRTSSGTFISASEDKSGTLDLIEEKIAKVLMIPRSHGEAFNVLRYEIGQKYNCHYDVFNPAEYGPQKSQRLASVLLYLSDVEEGGETMFPFENTRNVNTGYDYKKCIGLKVKPRQGDALLFYSMFPNGTFDMTALHGSCPVIKGEKWVATKWVRDQEDAD